jgi:hypothetical protein
MNDRKKGLMTMSGEIVVSGPDVIEQLAAGKQVMFDDGMGEFYLQVKPGNVRRIESFSPLVWADKANVVIENDAMEHCGEIGMDVAIFIKQSDERSVGFNISAAQAEALLHVLSNFVAASKACDELEKPYDVKAA